MVTEKINWLDGKSADGMFVIEMFFVNGRKGYLKNETYEVAMERYSLFLGWNELISLVVHDPSGKVVKYHSRYSEAV